MSTENLALKILIRTQANIQKNKWKFLKNHVCFLSIFEKQTTVKRRQYENVKHGIIF